MLKLELGHEFSYMSWDVKSEAKMVFHISLEREVMSRQEWSGCTDQSWC